MSIGRPSFFTLAMSYAEFVQGARKRQPKTLVSRLAAVSECAKRTSLGCSMSCHSDQTSTTIVIRNGIVKAVLVFYSKALFYKAFSCFYMWDKCPYRNYKVSFCWAFWDLNYQKLYSYHLSNIHAFKCRYELLLLSASDGTKSQNRNIIFL